MDTHYTDMKGKPCPIYPTLTCNEGYCPSCPIQLRAAEMDTQRERARELVKEIENLKGGEKCQEK